MNKIKTMKTSDIQFYVNTHLNLNTRYYRKMKRELQRRFGFSDLDRLVKMSNSSLYQTLYAGIIAALLILSLFMSRSPLTASFWFRLLTTTILGITALGIFLHTTTRSLPELRWENTASVLLAIMMPERSFRMGLYWISRLRP